MAAAVPPCNPRHSGLLPTLLRLATAVLLPITALSAGHTEAALVARSIGPDAVTSCEGIPGDDTCFVQLSLQLQRLSQRSTGQLAKEESREPPAASERPAAMPQVAEHGHVAREAPEAQSLSSNHSMVYELLERAWQWPGAGAAGAGVGAAVQDAPLPPPWEWEPGMALATSGVRSPVPPTGQLPPGLVPGATPAGQPGAKPPQQPQEQPLPGLVPSAAPTGAGVQLPQPPQQQPIPVPRATPISKPLRAPPPPSGKPLSPQQQPTPGLVPTVTKPRGGPHHKHRPGWQPWLPASGQAAATTHKPSGPPPPSAIWHGKRPWATERVWHPTGAISNVFGGKVLWANVSMINLQVVIFLCVLAYPLLPLGVLMLLTLLVGLCLSLKDGEDAQPCSHLPMDDDFFVFPTRVADHNTQHSSAEPGPVHAAPNAAMPVFGGGTWSTTASTTPSIGHYVLDASPGGVPPLFPSDYHPPVLQRSSLTPLSAAVYSAWAYICCWIPAIMVFMVPVTLACLSHDYPQEVFTALSLWTSFTVFSNGVYMFIHGSLAINMMWPSMVKDGSDHAPRLHRAAHPSDRQKALAQARESSAAAALTTGMADACTPEPPASMPMAPDAAAGEGAVAFEAAPPVSSGPTATSEVFHWVIVPQYHEDVDVVSMCLDSIAQSTLAHNSIGVLLAMEARELDAKQKAEELRRRFGGHFHKVCISYHPKDLPNEPPGKASNLKWSFERLVEHTYRNGTTGSNILVTVSDADSEFDSTYFEVLTERYLQERASHRNLMLWQTPIFHIKNYHRQPSPVIVGTMFTTMQELSMVGDPNAIRFPYSTYTIPMELARRVGGWDAEWIAEDWHMGLKCFLLTLGRGVVQPLLLPTVNYTPEDDTWSTTCYARWKQAQRHALGFSDMSYYFMMLPLIFGYAKSVEDPEGRLKAKYLKAVWGMVLHGTGIMLRLVNVHVNIGVMVAYGTIQVVLRFVMFIFVPANRHISFLFDRTSYAFNCMFLSTMLFMLLVTGIFMRVYGLMKHRIEAGDEDSAHQTIYQNRVVHLIFAGSCFVVFGTLYFFGLALCVWRAAFMMIASPVFEHEVASKPKPRQIAKA